LPFINAEIPDNGAKNMVDYELKHGRWTKRGWSRRVWKAFSCIRVVPARLATHKTQENLYPKKTSLEKEFYVLVLHLGWLLFLLILLSFAKTKVDGFDGFKIK
jgi:hypothetical protein